MQLPLTAVQQHLIPDCAFHSLQKKKNLRKCMFLCVWIKKKKHTTGTHYLANLANKFISKGKTGSVIDSKVQSKNAADSIDHYADWE